MHNSTPRFSICEPTHSVLMPEPLRCFNRKSFNLPGHSHFRSVFQSFLKARCYGFDVSVSASAGETGWLTEVAGGLRMGRRCPCGILRGVGGCVACLPGQGVTKSNTFHPGSHGLPWLAGPSSAVGTGASAHLCIFRAFASVPQMLGLSSQLHPSLGIALGHGATASPQV